MKLGLGDVKVGRRGIVITLVLLALFIWGIIWLSGPLTVDDVRVPDVEDLMPGWEK